MRSQSAGFHLILKSSFSNGTAWIQRSAPLLKVWGHLFHFPCVFLHKVATITACFMRRAVTHQVFSSAPGAQQPFSEGSL